jgi:hypothetical protein
MKKNKGFSFLFFLPLVLVINLNSGCSISSAKSESKDLTSTDCQEGLVNIEQSSNSSVQLSIREAKCSDFHSNVKLTLKNTSDKSITGYEISSVQDYENKKAVKSAQGVRGEGVILKSGETKEIIEAVGFTNGTSYGKPVGKLQRMVIRISSIDFDDGTRWLQENLR